MVPFLDGRPSVGGGNSFVACTDDDSNNNGNGGGSGSNGGAKRLTQLTFVEDYGAVNTYSLTWQNDKISYILLSNSRRVIGDVNPSYDGGLVRSAFVYGTREQSGINVTMDYDGKRLKKMTIPRDGNYTLSYNLGGDLQTVDKENGGRYRLVWDDGNIKRFTVPEGTTYTMEYDDKYNPLNDVLRCMLGTWDQNINNIVSISTDQGLMASVSYTYDGNYPVSAAVSTDEGMKRVYFKYSDGTGLAPYDAPTSKAADQIRRVNPLFAW